MRISMLKSGLCALVLSLAAGSVQGSVVANWDASGRTWNSGDASIMNATAVGLGHTVLANSGIDAGELNGASHLVATELVRDATISEVGALSSWLNAGGILIITLDSGGSGVTTGNSLMSSLGASLNFSGGNPAGSSLVSGGNFASDGPPFNIVGQSFSVTAASTIAGGSSLVDGYVQYQSFGSGWIFAFGDHSYNNFFNPTAATVNGQMFINILSVPTPGAAALLGMGGLMATRRRRANNA